MFRNWTDYLKVLIYKKVKHYLCNFFNQFFYGLSRIFIFILRIPIHNVLFSVFLCSAINFNSVFFNVFLLKNVNIHIFHSFLLCHYNKFWFRIIISYKIIPNYTPKLSIFCTVDTQIILKHSTYTYTYIAISFF